ncbi:MAG: HAD-IIB family hydrolase [Magnetococcales bacterium]|nr:HAD-IIB family hydrolase [Magnetococcales bacterium]
MTRKILIATDLDRTLIPNGLHPQSPRANGVFEAIIRRPEVSLAYVTGRDLRLVQEAMTAFALPRPDHVVADVGTSIWTWKNGEWRGMPRWEEVIAPGWNGLHGDALAQLLREVAGIRLQERQRQGRFKLSYYWDPDADPYELVARIGRILADHDLKVHVGFSRDETSEDRFLDVLPAGAGKLGAVRFLMEQGGFVPERVLFSGDSGNDLDVLGSCVPSVLVANATDQVRRDALALSMKNGCGDFLYLARGRFGMNGCYVAGILEGLAHFIPETVSWMDAPS